MCSLWTCVLYGGVAYAFKTSVLVDFGCINNHFCCVQAQAAEQDNIITDVSEALVALSALLGEVSVFEELSEAGNITYTTIMDNNWSPIPTVGEGSMIELQLPQSG